MTYTECLGKDLSPGHEPLEDLDISCASRKAVQVPCSQVGGLSIGDFSGVYDILVMEEIREKPVDMGVSENRGIPQNGWFIMENHGKPS